MASARFDAFARRGFWSRDLVMRAAFMFIGVLAFTARLLPHLRGGGLTGIGEYDDGVHYASAIGVLHGLLPYRDFLFLQPPAIIVAVLPCAALGVMVDDSTGMLAARIAWPTFGALNALLVARTLSAVGRAAAIVGGLFYAVFYPAARGDDSVWLEVMATTGFLGALLVGRFLHDAPAVGRRLVLAGALAGAAMTFKIWGVVPVVVMAVWLAVRRRPVFGFLAGACSAAIMICVPFFVSSPGSMWQQVVLDQLHRRRMAYSLPQRLRDLTGLTPYGSPRSLLIPIILALAGALVVIGLAWAVRRVHVAHWLLAGCTITLLLTPSWFLHYVSLVTGFAALLVGSAAQVLVGLVRRRGRAATIVVAGLGVLALTALALPTLTERNFSRFPAARFAAVLTQRPGCVTTDEPMTLIQTNVLSRNLERGCRFVVDLGGQSYHRPSPEWGDLVRARNKPWQRFALEYLRSGDSVMIARFGNGVGFSHETYKTVRSWPVVADGDGYAVQQPRP